MTDAHYTELRGLLQTVLSNQQTILGNQQILSDEIQQFKHEVRRGFEVEQTGMDLGYATTRAVDARCELLEEEVRIIKSLIAQQVLPRLGAEFPDGYIPLEPPGPHGLPKPPS